MIKKLKTGLIFFLFLIASLPGWTQDIPDPQVPPKLVNDFAGIISSGNKDRLESMLVSFNDSTSTQIVVVTVKSLNGYDKNDFAQRLGQKWGIGQKGKNNGVIIIVKPKYAEEPGEVSIQTGYGLEGVLPDVTCKRIVDNEMIPHFREDDYTGGIEAAVKVIMAITHGEYTSDQYNKRTEEHPYGYLVPIIVLIIIFLMIRINKGKMHSVGKSLPFWASLWMLSSMGRGSHSGTWGDFRSGGGGFGDGGFGGFGGFGGGSFGGGGAGGSW
ncbi:MAG: TPM domain-containing protein [Bacteroidota bacterium]|nr:TPM domain-containing protein [Bacteroidota bacterium]